LKNRGEDRFDENKGFAEEEPGVFQTKQEDSGQGRAHAAGPAHDLSDV
jgi:hypothetical protein